MHGQRHVQTAAHQLNERLTRAERGVSIKTRKHLKRFGNSRLGSQIQLDEIFEETNRKENDQAVKNILPVFPNRLWSRIQWILRFKVVSTNWFKAGILVIIGMNCVVLAFQNPLDDPKSTKRKILGLFDLGFLVIFVIEALVKIAALGLIRRTPARSSEDVEYWYQEAVLGLTEAEYELQHGYFTSLWNWLDFIVVVNDLVSEALGGTSALTVLRALRLLRPLRAIQRVPRLQVIIQSVVEAGKEAVKTVLLVLFFLFIVFGAIALTLFKGHLHGRCVDSKNNIIASTRNRPCDATGNGFFKCPDLQTCSFSFGNPQFGTISFDNIFDTFYSLFWVSTLTTWDPVMYACMDAVSPASAAFFISFIFLVSFFAINLVLAVVADKYSEQADQLAMKENTAEAHRWEDAVDSTDVVMKNIQAAGDEIMIEEAKKITFAINEEYMALIRDYPKHEREKLPIDKNFLRTDSSLQRQQFPSENILSTDPFTPDVKISQEIKASLAQCVPAPMSSNEEAKSTKGRVKRAAKNTLQKAGLEKSLPKLQSSSNGQYSSEKKEYSFISPDVGDATTNHASKNSLRSPTETNAECKNVPEVISAMRPNPLLEQKPMTDTYERTRKNTAISISGTEGIDEEDINNLSGFRAQSGKAWRQMFGGKGHGPKKKNLKKLVEVIGPEESRHKLRASTIIVGTVLQLARSGACNLPIESKGDDPNANRETAPPMRQRTLSLLTQFAGTNLATGSLKSLQLETEMRLVERRRELAPAHLIRQELQKEWLEMLFERDKVVSILKTAVFEHKKNQTSLLEHLETYPCLIFVHQFTTHRVFQGFVAVAILLDAAVAGANHQGMSSETESILRAIALGNTILFAIEALLKILAGGWAHYWGSDLNKLDLFLVLISVIEVGVDSGDMVSQIRTLRIFRIFILLSHSEDFRILLITVHESIPQLLLILLLMLLFMFIFTIIGVSFYAGKLDNLPEIDRPRQSFDTFYRSFLVVYQMLSGDSWPDVTWALVGASTRQSILYSAILYLIGTYVVMNIFVAALLSQLGHAESDQVILRRLGLWIAEVENDFVLRAIQLIRSRDFERERPPPVAERTPPTPRSSFGITIEKSDQRSTRCPSIEMIEMDMKARGRLSATRRGRSVFDFHSTPNSKMLMKSLMDRYVKFKRAEIEKREKERNGQNVSWSTPEAPTGMVLGCIPAENRFRMSMFSIAKSPAFEFLMIICVMLNCIVLALNNPHSEKNDSIYNKIDFIVEVVFTAEMGIKFVAYGIFFTENAYFKNGWNWPDFVSIIAGWLGIGAIRSVRAIRPLRAFAKVKGMQLVLHSVWSAIPEIWNVALFFTLVLFMLGAIGVSLFKGMFGFCLEDIGAGASRSLCPAGKWRNADTNFDNIGRAMLTLFQLATLSDWNEIMYLGIDAAGVDRNRQQNVNEPAGLFFVACVFLLGFFVINLFVGALIHAFNENKSTFSGHFLMTESQANWTQSLLIVQNSQLLPFRTDPPTNPLRRLCYLVVGNGLDMSHPFEISISVLLILNTIVVCIQHHNQARVIGELEFYVGWFATAVFVLEAILKIIAWKMAQYFRSVWNIFDFSLAAISLATAVTVGYQEIANVFRILRLLRILRFIKRAPTLRAMFDTLRVSLPAAWNVALVMFVVFFIFAIVGIQLFGNVARTPRGFTDYANFSDFLTALVTLFRLSTGDMWELVMYGATIHPGNSDCVESNGNCGFTYAPLYFVLFMVIGGLILVNLFVAIVLENFNHSIGSDSDKKRLEIVSLWRASWSYFDRHNKGKIRAHYFLATVLCAPEPFGFGEVPGCMDEGKRRDMESKSQIDSASARLKKAAFLRMLGSRLDPDGMLVPFALRTKENIAQDVRLLQVFSLKRWLPFLRRFEMMRTPIYRVRGKWRVRYQDMINSVSRLLFKLNENVYNLDPPANAEGTSWNIYHWYAGRIILEWWRSYKKKRRLSRELFKEKNELKKDNPIYFHDLTAGLPNDLVRHQKPKGERNSLRGYHCRNLEQRVPRTEMSQQRHSDPIISRAQTQQQKRGAIFRGSNTPR